MKVCAAKLYDVPCIHICQVYLAAIAGHVPSEMVKCLATFLDFCYIVRRNAITGDDLIELKHILKRFHAHREIFVGTAGVTGTRISLPRQHSLVHYIRGIGLFGSPNGLCSSMTESKHIKAVKEPWRRSNHFNALQQMLVSISRTDKISAAFQIHKSFGRMEGTASSYTAMILRGGRPKPRVVAPDIGDNDNDDGGPDPGPKSLSSIELACSPGTLINLLLICNFIFMTYTFSSRLSTHCRSSWKSHPRATICGASAEVFI